MGMVKFGSRWLWIPMPSRILGNHFPQSPIPAANVSTVPQRSPLRYPGGKTWLIPHIYAWVSMMGLKPRIMLEPFCGGAVVSLTAIMDDLVERCLMTEMDSDVSDFWRATLFHSSELKRLIANFSPNQESFDELKRSSPKSVIERGFRSLVLNRTQRQGILAPGSSHLRSGESGKGLFSRWYPDTIARRVDDIIRVSDRIEFFQTDGVNLLSKWSCVKDAVAFIDPPYTAGGKSAGKRLYRHHEIDHDQLFQILSAGTIEFMMTYDQSPEIVDLIDRYGFSALVVSMDKIHHAFPPELVITREPLLFS